MIEIHEESLNNNSGDWGLTTFHALNEMVKDKELNLPSKLFFTKNEKWILIPKYVLGDFIHRKWGFSKLYGIKPQIVLLYNEKSIYNNLIKKCWSIK